MEAPLVPSHDTSSHLPQWLKQTDVPSSALQSLRGAYDELVGGVLGPGTSDVAFLLAPILILWGFWGILRLRVSSKALQDPKKWSIRSCWRLACRKVCLYLRSKRTSRTTINRPSHNTKLILVVVWEFGGFC